MSPSATGYPAVAGTTIESAKYNAVIADIATALTLSIAANGETTVTANIPLAGYKITGLGNASADTDALNRVTADARYAALAGGTFTGQVTISASDPILWINESDADADEKKWALRALNGDFLLLAYNDAVSSGSTPMAIARTGTTVDSITFAGTQINLTCTGTAVNGDLAVDGAITCTDKGSFTMELATDTTGGSVLASGTAYWKKVGGVVTMRLPALYAATSDTSLLLRGIPADCQSSLTGTYTQSLVVEGLTENVLAGIVIRIPEGSAYWTLTTAEGGGLTFPAGSGIKGIGSSYSGPVITYQVTD